MAKYAPIDLTNLTQFIRNPVRAMRFFLSFFCNTQFKEFFREYYSFLFFCKCYTQFYEFFVKTTNSFPSFFRNNTQFYELVAKATIFFFWSAQFHEFSVKTINLFILACLSATPKFRNFPWKQLIFFSGTPNFTNFPWKQSILFILVFLQHPNSLIFRESN